VENTVRALRRLAPGASLRTPRDADMRLLARLLRSVEPVTPARCRPAEVARVVLADQLRALDRASTGFFSGGPPEAARYGTPFAARSRAAAPAWAEAVGHSVLSDFLRGVPPVASAADGRRAGTSAEVLVKAQLTVRLEA
jgi:hypothetical protein